MFFLKSIVLLVFNVAVFGADVPENAVNNIHDITVSSVPIEKAPFVVSIRNDDSTVHFCTGSIVDKEFVLTSATCVIPVNNTFKANRGYTVAVGSHLIDKPEDVYKVSRVVYHEKFNPKTLDYNVALMKLDKPLVFGPKVQKVHLPKRRVIVKTGIKANVVGWGGVMESSEKMSHHLVQINAPMIPFKYCSMIPIHKRSTLGRMFCAGGISSNVPCKADIGSPLVIGSIQIGVASSGDICGDNPGVMFKTVPIRNWVDAAILTV